MKSKSETLPFFFAWNQTGDNLLTFGYIMKHFAEGTLTTIENIVIPCTLAIYANIFNYNPITFQCYLNVVHKDPR